MKNRSVRTKVVFSIIIILLLSISVSAFITLNNQRDNMLALSRRNLLVNNSILNTVIKNIMLSGEAPIAVNTMSDLKKISGFEKIEIYRRDGTIAFNDFETLNFVNNYQEKIMFGKTDRIDKTVFKDEDFRKTLESNTPRFLEDLKKRKLKYYFPILNYSQCRTCHGEDHFVRGVAFYQISLNNIFSRINSARKILLIIFITAGTIIAVVLVLIMQKIIIKPVLSIGRVVSAVGTGNLDIKSSLKSKDELGTLSEKINTMIEGLREKNRLELENSIIDARNNENKKYLDNITEGLILLNPDFQISNQYSKFVTKLFKNDDISGMLFSDFLYPDSKSYETERNEIKQFLEMVFNNTKTEMEMIMSINPLENKTISIKDTMGAADNIIINADFMRIMKDDIVENVMVIFEDRTDISRIEKELEDEKKKSESELSQIAAILNIGAEPFIDFASDAEKIISQLEKADAAVSGKDFLRDLHSFKGLARYLEFFNIADTVHQVETILSTGNNEGKSLEELSAELKIQKENITAINNRFKEFFSSAGKIGTDNPLKQFIYSTKKMVEKIASEQNKEIVFTIQDNIKLLPEIEKLKNPLIHLVRNALDHGIEDELERISEGKTEKAAVTLSFDTDNKNTIIILSDNGRGIDTESIKKTAVEKGILKDISRNMEKQDILKLMFLPGFSTKKNISELSGRGIGLDAVRDGIKKAGGRISVSTRKGKGTSFRILIPSINNPGGKK